MAKRRIFYDKHAKTKRRLLVLFLLMAFVLIGAGLGILKLSNMHASNMGLETIYQDRVVPLQQLKLISDTYAINVVDTAHKVLDGNMTWQEGREEIDETTGKIPEVWDGYMKTYLVAEETKLVDELAPLLRVADHATTKMKKIFHDEDRDALAEFVKKELYPSIDPVTLQIHQLFDVQIEIAKDVRDKEKLRYKFSWAVGRASVALSLILTVIIAVQWKRWRSIVNTESLG